MNKVEFIEGLSTTDSLSDQQKIDICQYYINNYPVIVVHPMEGPVKSKLEIVIIGGTSKIIDYAYQQLKKRVEEFKK